MREVVMRASDVKVLSVKKMLKIGEIVFVKFTGLLARVVTWDGSLYCVRYADGDSNWRSSDDLKRVSESEAETYYAEILNQFTVPQLLAAVTRKTSAIKE